MNSVKILQTNVWGGRIKDGLTRFITDGNYDVVCMQEAIWDNNDTGLLDLFVDTIDKIKNAADFKYDFRTTYYGVKVLEDSQFEVGIAILSKIPFIKTEEKIVYGEYTVANNSSNFEKSISSHMYPAQKVALANGLTIVNYHGYWLKDPLGDETSVRCMRSVADMIKGEAGPVAMCGDLNVVSESPAMRELDFLEDLIATNQVKTTLRNLRFVKDVACDHILISKAVSCEKFEVIDNPASDHKALSVSILL